MSPSHSEEKVECIEITFDDEVTSSVVYTVRVAYCEPPADFPYML